MSEKLKWKSEEDLWEIWLLEAQFRELFLAALANFQILLIWLYLLLNRHSAGNTNRKEVSEKVFWQVNLEWRITRICDQYRKAKLANQLEL